MVLQERFDRIQSDVVVSINRSAVSVDVPVSWLRDVVMDSNLVVRGEVAKVRTLLNTDRSRVETEYTIRPMEALKDEGPRAIRAPGAVPPILARTRVVV